MTPAQRAAWLAGLQPGDAVLVAAKGEWSRLRPDTVRENTGGFVYTHNTGRFPADTGSTDHHTLVNPQAVVERDAHRVATAGLNVILDDLRTHGASLDVAALNNLTQRLRLLVPRV